MGDEGTRSGGRLKEYADSLIKTAVLTVPVGLIALVGSIIQGHIVASPWTVLWVGIPIFGMTWLTLRLTKQHLLHAKQWPWFVCLVLYCGAFALASSSDVLVWRTVPRDPQGIATREWLLPVRAGDWRYWMAPRPRNVAQDMVVVLMAPQQGSDARAQLRAREAQVLRWAVASGAVRGVGMDLYFEERTASDGDLCVAVEAARAAAIPVWSGYTYRYTAGGHYVERPASPVLPCLPLGNQGHLVAFRDLDGRVRAVKLYWEGMRDRPAFSVRAMNALTASYRRPETALPDSEAIWFLPPTQPVEVLSDAEVGANPELLRGKLVIVGLNTPTDRFLTPFGVVPGSVIHAYAAYSLLSGRTIMRPAAWWSVVCVFSGCYVLTLLALAGWSVRRLLVAALCLSLAVASLAALAMSLWLIWLPVIYAVTGMWVLVPVLVGLRRKLGAVKAGETEGLKFVN